MMDRDNEGRPLLYTYPTSNSRARRYCRKVPPEVTITGVILALFLVVVTLLVVLQNLNSPPEDEVKLDSELLGSPLKYNKKSDNKAWHKKDSKDKNSEFIHPLKENDDWLKVWKQMYEVDINNVQQSLQKRVDKEKSILEYLKKFQDSSEKSITKEEILKFLQYSLKDKDVDEDLFEFLKDAIKEEDVEKGSLDQYNLQKFLKDRVDTENTILEYMKKFQDPSDNSITEEDILNFLHGSKKEEDSDKEQLDSPFKLNKMKLDEAWQDKKSKYSKMDTSYDNRKWDKVNKGWKKNFPFEYLKNSEDSLQKNITEDDILKFLQGTVREREGDVDEDLLGSPFKFNKKEFDETWQNQKAKFSKMDTSFGSKKWDNINKEWKKKFEYLKKIQESSDKPITDEDILKFFQGDTKEENVDKELLGSPFKFNKKELDETWQDQKAKFSKMDTSFDSRKWDNINKEWEKKFEFFQGATKKEDIKKRLLGSPFKFNKKVLDETWQDKKAKYSKLDTSYDNRKWDKVNKGWKTIFPFGNLQQSLKKTSENNKMLTSPFKYNKKEFDHLWKRRNETNIFSADINYDGKWDKVNKGWKDVSNLDQKWIKEMKDFHVAWKSAESRVKDVKSTDEKNFSGCFTPSSNRSVAFPSGCPFGYSMNKISSVSESQINCALIAEQVRRDFGRCIDLSFLPKECKPSWNNKCFSSYKYRSIDGSCNNQKHPTWGKSGTPYVRMIAPDYGDGVSSVRTSKNEDELPNARFLSRNLYSHQMRKDSNITMLFLGFGLIVDHDMVETAINADGIPCCEFDKDSKNRPQKCLEIEVSEDDPFYGPRGVKCLNLVRSTPVHGECIGRREQLNKATSFLDGSAVYGSTIQKSKTLRSFRKGQLRTQDINNTPFMKFSEASGYNCGTPFEPFKCFDAGDSRVNMLVILTAMHTLWYREHNRIAEELQKINPKWIDEKLYQEARRILIAEIQHITFNEFLPSLLGDKALEYYELSLNKKDYNGYDDTINPSVFNVFGSAAFRFGHSLIQDMINLVGKGNKSNEVVAMHETYFNPHILYHEGLDQLLRGAASQKLHSVDSFITKEVREHLFQAADKDFGHDLAAVGIERGRDHGLPGYTKWRSVCGLSQINSWKDLKTVINEQRAKKLEQVYDSVEDIDLIPGALGEDHTGGSQLGPTYTCLIGRQFKKTRKGDRFWFETQDQNGSFSKGQLQEIYNSNIARIVCDNSDKIEEIQKYAFKIPSSMNPTLKCEDVPKVNLSQWKAVF